MRLATLWLVLILAVLGGLLLAARCRLWPRAAPRRGRWLRRWRPRTPADCPHCRQEQAYPPACQGPAPPRPWREGRSRRGAPRRIATEGYACRRSGCTYYGITDALVHALIAAGRQGRTDHIQQFRCQACGAKVSARWGTALAHLKTPPGRIGEVLSALAEGLDVCAAVRVFGHGEATITRWRDRAAQQADRLHDQVLRDLQLPHLQLDEIRTRLRPRRQVTWLWLALDPRTKLIPALALGARTQQTAHSLIHALRATLAPTCVPLVTTDGLRHYYYALTAHFGHWVSRGRRQRWQVDPRLLHGQVQKQYRRRRVVHVRRRTVCGRGGRLRLVLRALGWSGLLQTAFVERLNLTVRQSVAALTRRTWATAQTAAGLRAQVAWWRGYYHFVRPHLSLRWQGRCRTPAMAAGLTTHRWTTVEFLSAPCVPTG
jgi:IS1 family transposase/transposase-like protein